MAELTLFHMAPSRSSTILWMLEEVGAPYDVHLLRLSKGENRESAYLAVNPMGKVPALVHDGHVITETAAIALYLADAFPDAGLTVPLGDSRRGALLRWMFFQPGSLEPAIIDRMMKREVAMRTALPYGDFDTTMDVLANALETGPYLLGEQFTAADVVIGASLRWGMYMKVIEPRAEFAAYAERLMQRPALQRQLQKDKEFMQAAAA